MHVSRYHPLLVTLHWLLAALIIAALIIGFFWLAATPNADTQKLAVLRWHMACGMPILILMLIRLVVRLCTSRPADATAGHPLLDRLVPIAHYGFYILVVLMVASGFATAILAGLPAIVFGNSGDPLPPNFAAYPSWAAHRTLAIILAGLIGIHVLAALYHHFVMKDGLLRRMLFGRRTIEPRTAGNDT